MIKEDTRVWLPTTADGLDHYPLTTEDRRVVSALVELVGATRCYRLNSKTDEYVGYALDDAHDTVVLMQRKTYVTVPARAGVDVETVITDHSLLRPTTHNIEAGGSDVRLSGWSRDWPGDAAPRGTATTRTRRAAAPKAQPWDNCRTCGVSCRNGWQCMACERLA